MAVRPNNLEPALLIVDDSEDSRRMCAECLALLGFRVLEARTGREAVELACRVDAVLMDLTLPEIDGLEAARRIRTDPRCARVALVALTGLSLDEIGLRAELAGFDRVLGKPCSPDEIAAAVRNELRRTA